LKALDDDHRPVPEAQREHGVSSETHPTGVGIWYLIARSLLGSTLKLSRVISRVFGVSQQYGEAEPQPLLFPGFNLIEIAPCTNAYISKHTSHGW